jgi:hypothetical protein
MTASSPGNGARFVATVAHPSTSVQTVLLLAACVLGVHTQRRLQISLRYWDARAATCVDAFDSPCRRYHEETRISHQANNPMRTWRDRLHRLARTAAGSASAWCFRGRACQLRALEAEWSHWHRFLTRCRCDTRCSVAKAIRWSLWRRRWTVLSSKHGFKRSNSRETVLNDQSKRF